MGTETVNAWDSKVLLVSDATVAAFGVTLNPATAQAFECVACDLGDTEVGDIRPKKDRNVGRGMQSGFVEGRVKGIPFTIESSVKTRATNITVPFEAPIYRAAGLVQTVGGSSVTYTPTATPLVTANGFLGLSAYRSFGTGASTYEAEQLRGGVVKTIDWSGGDKELMMKAAGDGIGKYHLGYSASVTFADGVGTSLVFASVEEGYRFGLGFYQIESEVIRITAMNYTTFTATVLRAQLSSSGAAHTAAAMYPYVTAMAYTGTPISEGGTVTTVIDGITMRTLSFDIGLSSGMDLLPGESGSKYIQGPKATRYDLKIGLKLVLTQQEVALLGKATNRNTCAVSIVQSTGAAGGIFTFAAPYCEVVPFKVPDTTNDVCIVDVGLRCRDNAGNDMFTLTLT